MTPISAPQPRQAPALYAEPIRCGLQDRRLGGLVSIDEKSWRVALLESGRASLADAAGAEEVAAPALIWLPWGRETRLTARAGAVGALLTLGERALSNAIGVKPEAADLRVMAERRLVLPLAGRDEAAADVARLFDLILREAAGGAAGAETVIEAQVRVLLVTLWRAAAAPGAAPGAHGAPGRVLQRFRQLVETHFRDRWGVAAYAAALGLTPDRLHDVCTRALGRPPLTLIHERLTHEAKLLLERSSQTIDQVALHLGFRSAAQFSKFFKARAGLPPRAYRARLRDAGAARMAAERSYADWP